jgi:hypothetical protein
MKSNTTRRVAYITNALTLLAIMPFENGAVAAIIPPKWKPYLAAIGVIANLILDEMKLSQTATKTEVSKKQNKIP